MSSVYRLFVTVGLCVLLTACGQGSSYKTQTAKPGATASAAPQPGPNCLPRPSDARLSRTLKSGQKPYYAGEGTRITAVDISGVSVQCNQATVMYVMHIINWNGYQRVWKEMQPTQMTTTMRATDNGKWFIMVGDPMNGHHPIPVN